MFRNRDLAVNSSSGSGSGGGKVTNGFRLTLTSGTPITTTDVTGATTVYMTPHTSDEIAIFDGVSTWTVRTTAEISIALGTLTNGANYDVFAYWSGSAVALELSSAWTSNTARNDAVVQQNGVWVKSADKTRRYVGTFRTTSTTQTEDSIAKRFLWNQDNRTPRLLQVRESTANWSMTAGSFRPANNAATNCFEYVAGYAGLFIEIDAHGQNAGATGQAAQGIGIDSTTVNSAQIVQSNDGNSAQSQGCHSNYKGYPGLGYHKITWLEAVATATQTLYGTYNTGFTHLGMFGSVMG